jgi:hypothetical protein
VTGKPAWMDKHPCTNCGTGYGECAQGLVISMMCCRGCEHPSRWQPDAYTAEELAEIRQGIR